MISKANELLAHKQKWFSFRYEKIASFLDVRASFPSTTTWSQTNKDYKEMTA